MKCARKPITASPHQACSATSPTEISSAPFPLLYAKSNHYLISIVMNLGRELRPARGRSEFEGKDVLAILAVFMYSCCVI